jgi:hypothetical protein
MKRSLLFLFFSVVFITSGFSQSFVIKDKSGVDVTGQTISQYFAPGYGFGSVGLDVFNTSTSDKSVKVKKQDIVLVDSTTSNICWMLCYPDWVIETPDPLLIQAGSHVTNFTGDVTYKSIQGVSKVKFIFFDIDNRQDSSFVVIDFIVGSLGMNNNQFVTSGVIMNAYPNPASSSINFDYKLPASVARASIKVTNLLGTIIDNIILEKSEGKISLNVNNLKNGIYFYSLMINNSATITRKFVVKR